MKISYYLVIFYYITFSLVLSGLFFWQVWTLFIIEQHKSLTINVIINYNTLFIISVYFFSIRFFIYL